MEEPYSVITLIPVACSNIGPNMLNAAVNPPDVSQRDIGRYQSLPLFLGEGSSHVVPWSERVVHSVSHNAEPG